MQCIDHDLEDLELSLKWRMAVEISNKGWLLKSQMKAGCWNLKWRLAVENRLLWRQYPPCKVKVHHCWKFWCKSSPLIKISVGKRSLLLKILMKKLTSAENGHRLHWGWSPIWKIWQNYSNHCYCSKRAICNRWCVVGGFLEYFQHAAATVRNNLFKEIGPVWGRLLSKKCQNKITALILCTLFTKYCSAVRWNVQSGPVKDNLNLKASFALLCFMFYHLLHEIHFHVQLLSLRKPKPVTEQSLLTPW